MGANAERVKYGNSLRELLKSNYEDVPDLHHKSVRLLAGIQRHVFDHEGEIKDMHMKRYQKRERKEWKSKMKKTSEDE